MDCCLKMPNVNNVYIHMCCINNIMIKAYYASQFYNKYGKTTECFNSIWFLYWPGMRFYQIPMVADMLNIFVFCVML